MLLYPDAVEKAPEMIDMFQVEHFLLFFFFYKILYILTVVLYDKGGTIKRVLALQLAPIDLSSPRSYDHKVFGTEYHWILLKYHDSL